MVIIGALAAVSAPLFFSKDTFEQRGFYDELLSAARYAQKLAVGSCSPVRLNVTASGYSLFRAASAGSCDNPCTVAATPQPLADPGNPAVNFVRTAPAGVALTAADVVFCPSGAANASATIGVGSRQLRIWADTGYVQRL